MPSSDPIVSVVLPCFNAERSVRQAVESLRSQTYSTLEILTLDDGSTDGTRAVLHELARHDPRMRVLRGETNRGLISMLNWGVREARGEFIARMDADDVALPDRIRRQVNLLAKRPDVGLVGTGIQLVAEDGRRQKPRPVRCFEPGGARFMAVLGTPVAHVTIVARAAVMKENSYGGSGQSLHTEDYELFTRMLSAGVRFANLPDPLVRVRIDPQGVSLGNEQIQVANFVTCARRYFDRTLPLRPSAAAHRVLVNRAYGQITPDDLVAGLRLLDEVEQLFLAREPTAKGDIQRAADLQRVDILVQATRRGGRQVRLEAARQSLRYGRRLMSAVSRHYLASKLP